MKKGNRRPRESFTLSLKRIAQRIDDNDKFRVDWESTLLRKRETSVFMVISLWAFGSWARGSSDCGDLDLIAEISVESGYFPNTSAIRRTLVKGASNVRLYIGTPEKNESETSIDDAVLIWSTSNRDWENNIKNVVTNPSAKRYKRETDQIPLRMEQIYATIGEINYLLELRSKKIFSWKWFPFSDLDPEKKRSTGEAEDFFEKVIYHSGKKTAQAMSLVVDWFELNDPIQIWKPDNDSKAAYYINGNRIHIGKPNIPLGLLDDLSCYSIMLVPHISRLGPNGIWRIRRGELHPVMYELKDVEAYYLTIKNNRPIIRQVDFINFYEMDLFGNCIDAKIQAKEETRLIDEEVVAEKASIDDLLRVISLVDQVVIDESHYAISFKGERLDGYSAERLDAKKLKDRLMKK